MVDFSHLHPLMFVGNRRSGTSLLTELLNSHKRIYVSLEISTLWWLYSNHSLDPYPDYAWGPYIRYARPECFSPTLPKNVRHAYFTDILWVKDHGILNVQDDFAEKTLEDLVYVGDKTPYMSSDPAIVKWYRKHLSDTRYIHLVRNPINCIQSMCGLWWEGTPDEIAKLWVKYEHQALTMKNGFLLRYEDLCSNPGESKERICDFLDLDVNDFAPSMKRGEVMDLNYALQNRRGSHEFEITSDILELADFYGYEL